MARELFYCAEPEYLWIYEKGIKIKLDNKWFFAVIENGNLVMKNEKELFEWVQNG